MDVADSLAKYGKWHEVLVMNDDKSLALNIGFFGFSLEQVNSYIQKKYASSKKWTKFKFSS